MSSSDDQESPNAHRSFLNTMPLPKLSPLQSRLATSLMASCMLLILYLVFSLPNFAYALELDSIPPEDHNHERLSDPLSLDLDVQELDLRDAGYEADFMGADRAIIGHVPRGSPQELGNNQMVKTNVEIGQTVNYMFSNVSLTGPRTSPDNQLPSAIQIRNSLANDISERDAYDKREDTDTLRLRPRQSNDPVTLYVTVNVCQQPAPNDASSGPAPQLHLYLSQSPANTNPGPDKDSSTQTMLRLEGGACVLAVNATGNVYLGLGALNISGYQNNWNAQIAASIDAPYHYYHVASPNLVLADSDSTSALLVTQNLTNSTVNSTLYNEWMDTSPPFTIFAARQDNPAMLGVQNSYCGLQNYADFGATNAAANSSENVETGMTSRGFTQGHMQQFYVKGLSNATSYYGVLALSGNSSANAIAKRDGVAGGGQVFRMMNFTTLSGMYASIAWHRITDLG